jgi:hypothetical protein
MPAARTWHSVRVFPIRRLRSATNKRRVRAIVAKKRTLSMRNLSLPDCITSILSHLPVRD